MKISRLIAAAAAATLILAPGAAAQDLSPRAQDSLADFGSCLATTKKADVLFVLDESGSLAGEGVDTPTDPEHVRVEATRDLVTQFETLAADLDADINIKLAGFGEHYRSDPATYGEWTNARDGVDKLSGPIDGFRDRANDGFTTYGAAFDGMLAEFARHSDAGSCKATLFFTDGLLTVPGGPEDDAAARAAICSPDSPIGTMRRAGIQMFSVGLMPTAADTPEELLRNISEEDGCVPGTTANGAFFNAGTDPAGLFSAFRNIIPSPGSVGATQDIREPFPFVLDDSIAPVRISAQPTSRIDAPITPVLTAPDGQTLDLSAGEHTLGDARVTVTEVESLPGMFDGTMELSDGGSWAGEWQLGYRVDGEDGGEYSAAVQISPGLTLQVAESTAEGLRSTDPLSVSLVRADGSVAELAGTADLTAVITGTDGTEIVLGQPQSIAGGTAVVSLEDVDRPLTGELTLRADITTQGDPGTALTPVQSTHGITVTPVNMPRIPGAIHVDLEDTETTFTVPVSGPGAVWIEEGELGGVLPSGIDSLRLTSPHNSPETALQLAEGESGELEVTASTDTLADGPVALEPVLHLISAEGDTDEPVTVPLNGSMRAPVSASAFGLALVVALLLALLIPLGLLYLLKYLTGTVPKSPGLHTVAFPVKVENGRLLRTDTGGDFTATYDEVVNDTQRLSHNGRSLSAAGRPLSVKLGANPFTPARVAVPGTVMTDQGGDTLPLAVHNHWYAEAGSQDQGHIVLLVDELISRDSLDALVADIAAKGPDRLERALDKAPEVPEEPETQAAPSDSGWGASSPGTDTGWGPPSDTGWGPRS
ncbi:MAG TPA: VWA domain-containing protein [Corynebacterium pollutisoli]|nr:VWA domain-containing protein [Corynebacterium pollutisoli]